MTDEADRYERGAEIARGGMGRVVEAVDRRLGRTVAIKEMLPADGATRRRFEREVMITARLEHPSIVPIHDVGEWRDGEPFYVMRKVSGRPLDEMIAAAGSLDGRLTLLPHMAAVVDAIAHAHGRGIVHRDLKPANVVVGEHGETMVIDWGLAKVIGEDGEEETSTSTSASTSTSTSTSTRDATQAGEVVGTPGFMAPEQALAEGVDARADVFALGACFYQLLAGAPPFHGASATEVLDRTVVESPVRIAELAAGVPPDLVAIVEKAMAIDPLARYPDAAGLRDDLRRFLAGQLVAAHHYSPAQRLARAIRRYRAPIAVAALALAIVVVVGVLSLRRMFADRDRIARARTEAVAALARERLRADELVVAQAAAVVTTDPTLAIATLKQLAPDSPAWERARPLVAAARGTGIARGYVAGGGEIARAAFGPGDLLVTTAGAEVIVHDLAKRTSRTIATVDRWIAVIGWAGRSVVWRDDSGDMTRQLRVVDVDTGVERVVAWPSRIQNLATTLDGLIAFSDDAGKVMVIDLTAGLTPVELALPEPAQGVTASPSGQWLVAPLAHRTLMFHRGPGATWTAAGAITGVTMIPRFDRDETRMAALALPDTHSAAWPDAVDVALVPGGVTERHRWKGLQLVDVIFAGDELIATTVNLGLLELLDGGTRPPPGVELSARVGWMSPAPRGVGWTYLAADNRVVIQRGPIASAFRPPAPVQQLIASPTGPYLVGLARSVALVWNLDDALPSVEPIDATSLLVFLDQRTVITTHARDIGLETTSHDVVTGKTAVGPVVPYTFQLLSIRGEQIVAFERGLVNGVWIDRAFDRAHRIPVPGATAAFEFGPGHLVVATGDGTVSDVDQRTQQATEIARVPTMDRIASNHRWLVALTAAGAVWRRSPDGREQTLQLDPPASSITVDADGETVAGRKTDFVVWSPSGTTRLIPFTSSVRAADLVMLSHQRVAMFALDTSVSLLDLGTGALTGGLPACGNPASLADDGLIVAAVCQNKIQLADLATGETWSLSEVAGGEVVRLAISGDGDYLSAIVGYAPFAGQLVVWHLGLPRGPALAAWVQGATNAAAPHAGAIEWQ